MAKKVVSDKFDFVMLGKNIREARLSKEKTQKFLADKMCISTTQISYIENGRKKINLERLAEISTLLEINISELIEGSNRTSPEYKLGEFSSILLECSPEQRQQLYEIAKTFPKPSNDDNNYK